MRRQEHDSAGIRSRLLLRSGDDRLAEPLHAAHEYAADTHGIQPADRLPVRVGVREPGMDSPSGEPLGISATDTAAWSAAVWAHGSRQHVKRKSRLADARRVCGV